MLLQPYFFGTCETLVIYSTELMEKIPMSPVLITTKGRYSAPNKAE
jgi:hypothetical protein